MAATAPSIRSSYHSGAITVTVPRLPDYINVCQCTICRRHGAAWGYYRPDEVEIQTKPNAVTKQYIWGDADLSFNFCDVCGCVYVYSSGSEFFLAPRFDRIEPNETDGLCGAV